MIIEHLENVKIWRITNHKLLPRNYNFYPTGLFPFSYFSKSKIYAYKFMPTFVFVFMSIDTGDEKSLLFTLGGYWVYWERTWILGPNCSGIKLSSATNYFCDFGQVTYVCWLTKHVKWNSDGIGLTVSQGFRKF